MDDKQSIVVLDQNGVEKEAEVISTFSLNKTGKKYMIYTLNEKDENGMVKLYAAILVEKDGMYSFDAIEDEKEWNMIKEVMKQMAQE